VNVCGEAVVDVLADPVVTLPSLPVGIDVHHDATEVRQVMQELVANLLRDLVTLSLPTDPRTP
jgi:hypothetical protein